MDLESLTWEQRFYVALDELMKMQARAKSAEAIVLSITAKSFKLNSDILTQAKLDYPNSSRQMKRADLNRLVRRDKRLAQGRKT